MSTEHIILTLLARRERAAEEIVSTIAGISPDQAYDPEFEGEGAEKAREVREILLKLIDSKTICVRGDGERNERFVIYMLPKGGSR